MIALRSDTRIYVCTKPTDMRKGFDGLFGQVVGLLEEDPLSGHLFLFINRRADRCKILYWDGDGLAIWYKRLEQGSYQALSVNGDEKSIQLQSDELMMLLRGVDLDSVRRRKRYRKAG